MSSSPSRAGRSRARRPRSLKIGYTFWSVEYLTSETWDKRLGSDNSGETHAATNSIYLVLDHPSGPMSEDSLREVLLHEILHACFFTSNIGNTMKSLKRDDLEEAIVGAVSPDLLGVLRDNPHLTKWLLEN